MPDNAILESIRLKVREEIEKTEHLIELIPPDRIEWNPQWRSGSSGIGHPHSRERRNTHTPTAASRSPHAAHKGPLFRTTRASTVVPSDPSMLQSGMSRMQSARRRLQCGYLLRAKWKPGRRVRGRASLRPVWCLGRARTQCLFPSGFRWKRRPTPSVELLLDRWHPRPRLILFPVGQFILCIAHDGAKLAILRPAILQSPSAQRGETDLCALCNWARAAVCACLFDAVASEAKVQPTATAHLSTPSADSSWQKFTSSPAHAASSWPCRSACFSRNSACLVAPRALSPSVQRSPSTRL